MAPQVMLSPSKEYPSTLKDFKRDNARAALSPISSAKAHSLDAPTKKGLNEYNQPMSSLQSSLSKAVKSCRAFIDKRQLEAEREKARAEHIKRQREKAQGIQDKALAKAQAEGRQDACEELQQEDAANESAAIDGEDMDVWTLVQSADDLLCDQSANCRAWLS